MQVDFFQLGTQGSPEWGLVCQFVINGIHWDRDEQTGIIHVTRAGPFMPPLAYLAPTALVVSDAFRRWVETSGLGSFEFKPVVKKRIVEMNWHLWNEDSDSDIPIPDDCDLEEYFLSLPHSEEASKGLGDLWEWRISPGAVLDFDVKHPLILRKCWSSDPNVNPLAMSWH